MLLHIKYYRAPFIILLVMLFAMHGSTAQVPGFTRADTLRGSNGPYRAKWDVLKYEITVNPDYESKTISGKNEIMFFDNGAQLMQIDLQEPMILDSVLEGNKPLRFSREGNVYWLEYRDTAARYKIKPGIRAISCYFHGKPREAVQPPWDGGWIWKKDENGNPWMSVACQGLGASVWFPCKDIQLDEPDSGAIQHLIVPDSLVAVAGGRLAGKKAWGEGKSVYTWVVTSPINNYCIIPYIGRYVHFSEVYRGEKGKLDMDYWVLDHNLEKAIIHFKDAARTMKAFEYWFGPYPFYKDGYKLVDAPCLGMEHQGAIAYGNQYRNGYNNPYNPGVKWTNTKWEQEFDFIIVHESGHEWFGNNITTKDIADMWVHESFTCYSEVLFVENVFGKKAAEEYFLGSKKNIKNKQPMIGPYGVNQDGDLDIYYKGSAMINMIRHMINNDNKFREILRGLNKKFYHKTITSKQVEDYIGEKSKMDLAAFFDQYLRTTKIPVLEYKINGKAVAFRLTNTVTGLVLPLAVSFGKPGGDMQRINVSSTWQTLHLGDWYDGDSFTVDPDFYVLVNKVEQ